jgi:hypothetical protein
MWAVVTPCQVQVTPHQVLPLELLQYVPQLVVTQYQLLVPL